MKANSAVTIDVFGSATTAPLGQQSNEVRSIDAAIAIDVRAIEGSREDAVA
jgi:hypothetical protein